MNKEKTGDGSGGVSARAHRLLHELEDHPELLERFEAIVALTRAQELPGGGDGMNVDEVEERVVEEVRKLGRETMEKWAARAQHRAEQDFLHGGGGFPQPGVAQAAPAPAPERMRVRKKKS